MKVAEVAKLLGVSTRTIYRRIDAFSLTGECHDREVGKIKDVDLEGVDSFVTCRSTWRTILSQFV